MQINYQVFQVLVKVGDVIEKGQVIMTVEGMKMEVLITACVCCVLRFLPADNAWNVAKCEYRMSKHNYGQPKQ